MIDWLKRNSEKFNINTAIVDADKGLHFSYGQLESQSYQFALNLQNDYSIKKGDVIAVISNFNNELISLLGAALKLGFIIVPLNYRLDKASLIKLIAKVNAKLVLYSDDLCESALIVNKPVVDIEKLKSHNSENILIKQNINQDDALFVFFTSGSTGEQRGVIYTHKMMYWNMMNSKESLSILSEDSTMSTLPPFHSGGWNILLTPMLMSGASVILKSKTVDSEFFELVEEYSLNKIVLIPTQLNSFYNYCKSKPNAITSLQYIIVGGESLPIALIDKWHDLGVYIRQGYGLTEAGPSVTSLCFDKVKEKKGSIGVPNKYVEFDILNEEGLSCGPNELGEIVLRGSIVSPAYICKTLIRDQKGSWFHTGDFAFKDSDGYIYLKGRKDDMYISGGENIYPSEIENILREINGVESAYVIGVEDSTWGEVGIAFIKASEEVNLTDSLILNYLKNRIAKFKIPKKIIFVDNIPLNQLGKVDKLGLKNIYNFR